MFFLSLPGVFVPCLLACVLGFWCLVGLWWSVRRVSACVRLLTRFFFRVTGVVPRTGKILQASLLPVMTGMLVVACINTNVEIDTVGKSLKQCQHPLREGVSFQDVYSYLISMQQPLRVQFIGIRLRTSRYAGRRYKSQLQTEAKGKTIKPTRLGSGVSRYRKVGKRACVMEAVPSRRTHLLCNATSLTTDGLARLAFTACACGRLETRDPQLQSLIGTRTWMIGT